MAYFFNGSIKYFCLLLGINICKSCPHNKPVGNNRPATFAIVA